MQGQGPPGGYPPNPYGQPNPYDAQPPQGGYGQPPQNNYSQGTFDMGGGQQLRVKIDGQTPETYMTNRASGMVWGWIIGLGIVAVLVIGGGVLGIYVYMRAGTSMPSAVVAGNAAAWDGKTPLICSGNDHMVIANVTATAGIIASGNCHLTMSNVVITAPVGIEASGNAEVTFAGGSITSTTAIDASVNAKVTFAGTKVSGKQSKKANAKIVGI